jgi:hypothetical protein
MPSPTLSPGATAGLSSSVRLWARRAAALFGRGVFKQMQKNLRGNDVDALIFF